MTEERQQAADRFQEQVRQVAALLQWSYVSPHEDQRDDVWAKITNDTGASLAFYLSGGRIEITGCFPPHYSPHGKEHSISVAHSKEPIAIAADIKRRLLPAYLPAMFEALQRKALDVMVRAKVEALATKLAGICGGKVSGQENDRFYCYEPVHVEGQARDGGADLKISGLSDELAAQILRLIADHAKGGNA
jgi:hypothetical protein